MCWVLIFYFGTSSWSSDSKHPGSTLIVEGQLLCFRSCPGNLEQDRQINPGCACLRIDKDLLVDACERLSARGAALLIPSEAKHCPGCRVFFLCFFLGGRKRLRFCEASAGPVGSATPSARDNPLHIPCFFCTLSVLIIAPGPGVRSQLRRSSDVASELQTDA